MQPNELYKCGILPGISSYRQLYNLNTQNKQFLECLVQQTSFVQLDLFTLLHWNQYEVTSVAHQRMDPNVPINHFGVRQSYVLSPFLFAIYLDDIFDYCNLFQWYV